MGAGAIVYAVLRAEDGQETYLDARLLTFALKGERQEPRFFGATSEGLQPVAVRMPDGDPVALIMPLHFAYQPDVGYDTLAGEGAV